MDWKEQLKKIRARAEEDLEKEEAQAQALACDLAEKIEEAREIVKEFGSVIKARVRVLNQRHKEINPGSGETFYAGGILIVVRKKRALLGQLFKRKQEPLMARLKFPHPAAIMYQEGFEDCIEFLYSDTSRKATISEFSPQWLKQNLELAYSLFVNERKIT